MQCDLFADLSMPAAAGCAATPGSIVGARRWPFSSAHPDNWRHPHKGFVLDVRDERAWLNQATGQHLDAAQIESHLSKWRAQGDGLQSVPVLWDFSSVGVGSCVMWEHVANLRPYEEDLAQWRQLREQARAKEVRHGS